MGKRLDTESVSFSLIEFIFGFEDIPANWDLLF